MDSLGPELARQAREVTAIEIVERLTHSFPLARPRTCPFYVAQRPLALFCETSWRKTNDGRGGVPGSRTRIRKFGIISDQMAPQYDSYAILRIAKNRVGRENSCMKTMILDTLRSFNRNLRSPMNNASSPRALVLVALFLGCFAFLPGTQGQLIPPPDGCYPNFTTAEGCDALNSLTTGSGNTGLGWFALFSDTDGSFNTGVGAGALVLNNGTSNTAVGAAALLLNTIGTQNTAVGTDTLVFNDSGSGDTAIGYFALMNDNGVGSNTAVGVSALTANTTGFNNAAFGIRALESNIDGQNNTAVGNLALDLNTSGTDHVALGRHAGDGITIANNNVIVGHHSGVHSVFGEVSDRCFIDNIFGAPVSVATFAFVLIDSDGRLGTFTVDGPDPGGFSPKGIRPQAIPDAAKQAMLSTKVEELEATVAKLTAQLQEQAAQIQKVSAQLELNNSAARTVASDQ